MMRTTPPNRRLVPRHAGTARSRGAAMLVAIILIATAGLVVTSALLVSRRSIASAAAIDGVRARYAAESGIQMAAREIAMDTDFDSDGTVGSISDDGDDSNDPVVNGAPFRVSATLNGSTVDLSAEGTNAHSFAVRSQTIEQPASTGGGGYRLLFVIKNPNGLTHSDQQKKETFESWGFVVTPIDDQDSTANLLAAAGASDVVYVCESTYSHNLNTQLNDIPIGIVNEEWALHDDYGFSQKASHFTSTQINVVDNTHYITETMPESLITVTTCQKMNRYYQTIPADAQVLAERPNSSDKTLIVFERNAETYNQGRARGRRVSLPWFYGGSHNYSDLTSEGREISRRSLEWAAGLAGGAPPAWDPGDDEDE